jgi:hypothetical protein
VNIIRPLSSLKKTAGQRKPGYLEECLRVGKVSGTSGADMVEFTPDQHAYLRSRFSLEPAKGGWGDAVHRIAGPIGRAIHWPCMKGDGTTELKAGSPCDRARNLLNKL